MTRWGMVVDMDRCVGCHTCTIACKMENGLPPSTLWRTVLDVESGEFPDVTRTFTPMTCMHCADPPCHDACPTTATRVREDGIVWIEDDICIGCGSCVVACPYQARHIINDEKYYFGEATAPELATYDRGRVGICTKCHFCFHKFDEAPEGVMPGRDQEYTPACSSSCIGNAILFGDLENPESPVGKALAGAENPVRMLEHLDTDPSVYYLNPRVSDAQPLQMQHTWHGLAVSNFFCGTTGIGLYLVAMVSGWIAGGVAPLFDLADLPASLRGFSLGGVAPAHVAGLLGPLLVIAGLLSVGAEAGKPFRGFNVFRNLHRSWMSRESAFAMLFISLGLLDTLFFQSAAVQAAAILAGLGVMLAQGLILKNAKGVPAWAVPIMPAFFVSSGLLSGAGGWLLVRAMFGTAPGAALLAAALAFTAVDLAVWYRYLATPPKTLTFTRSVAVLRRRGYAAAIVGWGHAVPLALLAVALLLPAGGASITAAAVAGLAMVTGALFAKYALILKAAYLVDLFENFHVDAVTKSGTSSPAAKAA